MPNPAQVVASGTPVTSQQGTGAIAGNAITMSGLSLTPNQPGWTLTSSQGGPGFVTGTWQFGSETQARNMPTQGGFYRSNTGGAGNGGGDGNNGVLAEIVPQAGFQLTKGGWVLVGLIVTLILMDKKK